MPRARHTAPRHAAGRRVAATGARRGRRRRVRTGRPLGVLGPLLGIGLLAGGAVAVPAWRELPQQAVASAATTAPEVDLSQRVGALTRPSRAQGREPARPVAPPEPTATPVEAAPAPEPPPEPEPTGFPPVPGCDATVPEEGTVANGRLGGAHLCSVGDGHRLRPDAAAAFVAMAAAYEEALGSAPCVTDSYRSLAAQQELARRKPGLAARPGTSEHGWGLAVDLGCGVESYRSAAHRWLVEHGPAYGWVNPAWARPGGSRPEPWHWEYLPDSAG